MIYLLSFLFLISYTIFVFIFKNKLYLFGFNKFFDLISIIMSNISRQSYYIPYYDFKITEITQLNTGIIINLICFILFIMISLSFRLWTEDSDKKIKRYLSWSFFIISLLPLISAINNYSEIEKQNRLITYYNDIEIESSDNDVLLNKNLKLSSDLVYIDSENKIASVEKEKFKIEIKSLNLQNEKEYISLLKKRFTYNLSIKQFKDTKFKKNKALVIEYYLNNDYNRDYVIRVDKDFFVISLRANTDSKEIALKEFKDFLINSIYLQRS